jgi:PhzF family phenazine biosynthesis protein
VDAFASEAFRGNPAAVCVLGGAREKPWMEAVARETALPATAFVHPADEGFALRWFTASAELELCGHGTLATAHVLWETGQVKSNEPVRFQTRNGALAAVRRDGWIELDFPAKPEEPATAPPGLVEALGVSPIYVGRNKFDFIVEVAGEAHVRALEPDFAKLKAVPMRGVMVTSRSTDGTCDFVSRFFPPSVGINEDQVTGSAHCCLGPYWSRKLGKATLVAHQLSARGGVLRIAVDGDRVRLSGQAVTVIRGDFLIPAP